MRRVRYGILLMALAFVASQAHAANPTHCGAINAYVQNITVQNTTCAQARTAVRNWDDFGLADRGNCTPPPPLDGGGTATSLRCALTLSDGKTKATVQATLHPAGATSPNGVRNCHGAKARAGAGQLPGILVLSAQHTTCAAAVKVFTLVSGWAAPGPTQGAYRNLGAPENPNTLGYRCSVKLVGDSAWNLRCVRGAHVIRGYTAE